MPAWKGWQPLLLFVVVMAAYLPVLRAGFIWDDDRYVTKNPLLRAPDGLWRIWFSTDAPSQYVPLTYTSFWLEHSLWGLWATGYHCVNVLLHAVNALLLWQLLKKLAVPGALLAAALFALHPMNVESVAWISERKNVLSLLFILLATRAWVEFIEEPAPAGNRWYHQSLLFYALALASKATACTLPAALVVVLWLKGMPIDRRRMTQILPFVALGLGMGLIAMWWERHHQGTEGAMFSIGLIERILIASRAAWFYLGKLVWPANLTFIYPQWQISATDPRAYAWVLACLAAVATIYLMWRQKWRCVGIAMLFYAAMLAPVLGFIMLYTFRYTFVADHYQYVACISPLALLAAGFAMAVKRIKRGRTVVQIAIGVLLFTLGVVTWKQALIYRDRGTLWRDTLVKNPDCWMAENNLGNHLAQLDKPNEAMRHYERALQIEPEFAEAHYNMADIFVRRNDIPAAIYHLQEAVRIDPRYMNAHNNLGIALLRAGRGNEAITHFETAVGLRPRYSPSYVNLAMALNSVGRRTKGIDCLQQALGLNPNDLDAKRLLARWLASPAEDDSGSTDQVALPPIH